MVSMVLSYITFPMQIWLAKWYFEDYMKDKSDKAHLVLGIGWIIVAVLNFVGYCYNCGVTFNR